MSYIYKIIGGKYRFIRSICSYILIILFILVPHYKLPNGNPIFKFGIFDNDFILFGLRIFPLDFPIIVILIIVFIITITLGTIIYGRFFCGFICPQPIILDFIYKIIDQILNNIKKNKFISDIPVTIFFIIKHFLYIFVSIFFAYNISLYVYGNKNILHIINNKHHYIFIITLSIFIYYIFGFLRYKVCSNICPYGRLQSILLNLNTFSIMYDFKRGESKNGRKKLKFKENRQKLGIGDCIDCGNCIKVCPTGIDIRNGTQLECINCGYCADACNYIMDKIGFKKGLIRYTSENIILGYKKFKYHFLTIIFSILLIVSMIYLLVYLYNSRNDITCKILNHSGTDFLYEKNYYVNKYEITIYNRSNNNYKIIPILNNYKNYILYINNTGNYINSLRNSIHKVNMIIKIDSLEIFSYKQNIPITFYDAKNRKKIGQSKILFSGPFK